MADAPHLMLYNTLTREKAAFQPIDAQNVRLYVCGPTVYDFAHIGNARPVIVFDVLFRLLRHLYGADHVTYVRNITDVDDKINARALRDYPSLPLNDAIRAVTEKTEKQFRADAAALGSLSPTVEPRATENIAEMIAITEALIAKGHAYVAAGEVLFDTTSMADYGALSRRNLEEQQAGARIAVDAHKRSAGDFVLWKLSSEDEPGWESPWGRGRPGWHIECSAMSHRYLGETFDIHGGGLDLIFPHHENEIAQSRCAHGTAAMARVWMHNGFLQIEGRKMSKSDGNFVTISRAARNRDLRRAALAGRGAAPCHADDPLSPADRLQPQASRGGAGARAALGGCQDQAGRGRRRTPFVLDPGSPLLDDLNLSPVFAGMSQMAAEGLKGDGEAARSFLGLLDLLGFETIESLSQAASDLGLSLGDEEKWASVTARIAERRDHLAARNFAEADRIRDALLSEGIQLKDGKDPVTGERVTTWEIKR